MCEGGFPVVCVHGRDDVIVSLKHGRQVAALLGGEMVVLEGGHGLLDGCGHQVRLFDRNNESETLQGVCLRLLGTIVVEPGNRRMFCEN